MVDRIAEIVAGMARYYVESGRAVSAYEINCGSCADFAEAVLSAIASLRPVPDAREVWVDDMIVGEPGGSGRIAFDRQRMATSFPEAVPPDGVTWSDMDALSAMHDFAGGTHVWVCSGGRHYDAEAVEGVENPFDLPYFQRAIASLAASDLDGGTSGPSPRP